MVTAEARFDVRRIAPGTSDHRLALHLVLDVPPPAGDRVAAEVAAMLTGVQRGNQSIDLFFGAYRGETLIAAALAIESAGAAALVLLSGGLELPDRYSAALRALETLQPAAWQRSIILLEALTLPDSKPHARLLGEAGFRHLTRLIYLRRHRSVPIPAVADIPSLEWMPYTPDNEPLFARAIEQTYAETQDCPELSGLRPTADVLAGHRAAGIFDPALWRLAVRRSEPVGVLLLNRLTSEPALEVVYMGVAQPVRRQGVAHALLAQAVDTVRTRSDRYLTLAVDRRNVPALSLYTRWGFVEFGARDAWIASSVPV